MPNPLAVSPPPAQAKALAAAAQALALVASVRAPYRALAEQVITAAASVPANVVEGEGRHGNDRVYHFRVAYASAKELAVHLTLLVDVGAVDRRVAERVLSLLDEVRAMLWRMTHPR